MMKKYTLFLAFFVFSFCAFAAQLNPFAYGLRSDLSSDQSTLTVYYSLNAPATGVKVLVMNGNEVVKEVDCGAQKTLAGGAALSKGEYKVVIGTSEFPLDTDLTWKVEVKGAAVNSYAMHDVKYNAYHPSSIDIDNNTESPYFGRVLCNESMQKVEGLTKDSDEATNGKNYLGTENGAGIFEFNAAFEYIGSYNGGKKFPINRYGVTGTASENQAYVPRRIRISDDSRIFVTSLNSEGDVLWELNPDNLNEWTTVIADGTRSTATNAKRNIIDGSGNFIAGPNVGFDVHGSGEDLKLVMLSSADEGWGSIQAAFKCVEYELGTNTTWNKQPSKKIFENKAVYPLHAQVQYGKDGGVWFIQYDSGTNDSNKPGLAYWKVNNTNQTPDYIVARNNTRNAGFRYNNDYSKVIIANNNGNASVYDVTIGQNGVPQLSNAVAVNMTAMGSNLNDFAWDYADNIYVVSNSKEFVAVYPSPHLADKVVTTPAATKYAFEITKPNYDHPENHLAPFAYDLRTTTTGEGGRTKLHFMLNAHARRVQVWLIDEETKQEILLRDYPNEKSDPKDFVPYHPEGYGTVITTEDVEALNLEYGKNYSWRVDVWGKEVAAPNCVKSYSFRAPTAVDIDNNPNNPNFGMILANESMQAAESQSGYVSSGFGAGIFKFTPSFELVPNGSQPGYNGGVEFTTTRADDGSSTAYAPYRIRISEDGHIFVTSLNTDGNYLWKVNPNNLNEWIPVFKGTLNDNKELVDARGNFIAAPNAGFDVKGAGENLTLAMYSVNLPGIKNTEMKGFRLHEYNLGTASEWTTAPSKSLVEGKYAINYVGTQVEYDKEGGCWIASHRGTANTTNPGLVHINANGEEDLKLVWSNLRCAGIRFNKDFTKLIVAGVNGGSNTSSPTATVYTISKDANGAPVLTAERTIDMAVVGPILIDFAWDYAGNLYACGDGNKKLAAYVMPRSANDKVSTPAREEYMVNLTQPVPRIVAYNLTYRPNGAKKTYDFSFYVNTKPNAGGVIRFYKNNDVKTQLFEYSITQDLIQGDNTVSIPMATLDAVLNYEKDITWELTLSAPESNVFGKIYKSDELNTAYATINTNPATDYFGHVYAGNQQDHVSDGKGGGNIYVWAPGSGTNNNQGDRYHTIKTAYTPTLSPNNKNGFTQVSAPGIAPDGKVYFTDNGKDGGVYVMDPKDDYSFTSFFEGLEQNGIAQYEYNSTPVGTPSSSAHIYWTGGNTAKLFLVSTEYGKKYNVGSMNMDLSRYNAGYYIYPLTEQDGQWTHDWGETQRIAVTEDNIYQPNFTIVGTSHGAWYCQHRRNDWDVIESRSLMFFGNDGERKYCSTDEDVIYGSCGSGIAVNKEENLLAMASGLGGIMFFDITWNGDVPTLTHKYSCALNYNDVVTTLNFDYNNNLVATVGDSYNDKSDKHRMVVFTMPDMGDNTVTVPARFSQRVAALYADERMDVHFDRKEEAPYQTVDVFRQLQAGMYNTICLPFALETLENTPWQGSTVMKFVGTEHDATANLVYMNFSEVDFTPGNIMEAGMPYLILPKEDVADLARITPVWRSNDFTNMGRSVGGEHATFQGVINPTPLNVDASIFFLVANNRLATPTAAGDLMGMRAYFKLTQPLADNTKAVITVQHQTPTGMDIVPSSTPADETRKILQGEKIFIIRDGKIYNILGEMVEKN